MKEIDERIILAFAENDMNVKDTADSVFLSRNAVLYHFDNIQKETGKNPRVFFDLCDLLFGITSTRDRAQAHKARIKAENKREGSL